MTTIGMIGMGKMGQIIFALLDSRTDIAAKAFNRINSDNILQLKACDVVIEFTTPDAAPGVIRQCMELNIPVVSGTTGWHEYHLDSILSYGKHHHAKFLYATNFSIGMNVMFALNRKLAEVMHGLHQFKPSIREIHHIHKKDSPSGTAYTLIGDLLDRQPHLNGFTLTNDLQNAPADKLPVTAIREGEVKGFHEVNWHSGLEKLSISHEAFDRKIFAEGAIAAALWLHGQPRGIYTMRDMLNM